MAKKRGLGRGLDALLSGATIEQQMNTDLGPISNNDLKAVDGYQMLEVTKIQRGKYQPRRDLEPQARRGPATQLAGLDTIPVIVKDVSDEAAIAMALIENIQRENLNAMEEAIALKRLQDEFNLTQQEVATAVGKSRSAVTNLLRLTKLTEDVRKLLEYGDIEMGHARALLGLEGELQITVARDVAGKGMSVRQTEELVRKWQAGELPKVVAEKPAANVQLKTVSANLAVKFSTKVDIKQPAKGHGKITISFDSAEKLEEILKSL